MKNDAQQPEEIDLIRQNIARTGQHIYVVSGGPDPRFAYSIGVSQRFGKELIFAGASFFMKDEVLRIMNEVALSLKNNRKSEMSSFEMDSLGSFRLHEVHASWTALLMLGALHFYRTKHIPALQIVPDQAHWTIDIPDLAEAWNATAAPAWKWLREPWNYPVSPESTATTNLGALRGERVTEAMRWEEDEWELFAGAGPDVPKDELRVVPLGTMLACDKSLIELVSLPVGSGIWRDDVSDWRVWKPKNMSN